MLFRSRFLVVVRFASCSEDSLPLSCMHQFYSGYQLLPPHSTCVGDTSSCAFALELLRSFHVHHVFIGFFHSTVTIFGHFSLWILLYACKLKLKFSPCCTLSLRGNVKDILDIFLVKAQVQYFVYKLSKLFVLQSF